MEIIMGAKKDMNRVKELIFGNDITRFEEKFDALENQLDDIKHKQKLFKQDVKEYFKNINTILESLKGEQTHLARGLQQQGHKMDIYMEDMASDLQDLTQKNTEQLKTLKTELKMHIEAKLNSLDKVKISHTELSDMFASLSNELKDVDDKQRHTR